MSLTKIQTSIVVIALFIPLLYSIEAAITTDPATSAQATTGPVTGGPINLQEAIPKYELYLMKVMKHIDEGPASSPAETCLVDCMKTYDTEIEELKKFAAAPGGKFKSTINQATLTHCDECLRDVSKDDPRVAQDIEWFTTEIESVSKKMSA